MRQVSLARKKLKENANPKKADNLKIFFKNCQDDIFLGVGSTVIKHMAKDFIDMEFDDIQDLMKSRVHDERSLAHAILCLKFKKGGEKEQAKIFKFYLKNRKFIRDWDGVDDSAPYIMGPYLLKRDKEILYKLAKSKRIWDRRISMVTTWYFIRQNELKDCFKLAKILLQDKEDLIHKAVGWMLREAGKRDERELKKFLEQFHQVMPRTMLRYAIEKSSGKERKKYLFRTSKVKFKVKSLDNS
jgi:3-methyladenine DNA glycosylase AlkD